MESTTAFILKVIKLIDTVANNITSNTFENSTEVTGIS